MTTSPDSERKTLILTGASRGIGHATAKRFSTAGWRAITVSRHPFPENCPWDAGPEDHIQVDLADPKALAEAIPQMKERLKAQGSRLYALVNNAAISPKKPGGARLNSIETGEDDWKTVFQVNFYAPIMLARGLIAELEHAKGTVVNVTSIAGSRVHPFAGAAYATSKAAHRQLLDDLLRAGRQDRGVDLAWRDGVHAYSQRAEIGGHFAGEGGQRRLGGGIGRAGEGMDARACDRGHVHH